MYLAVNSCTTYYQHVRREFDSSTVALMILAGLLVYPRQCHPLSCGRLEEVADGVIENTDHSISDTL
jgi:hypothetical protein